MPTEKEWNIRRASLDEYRKHTSGIKNIFNSPAFNDLNSGKVDEVCYLLIRKGESDRFGITFGRRGDELDCPFSAPFGYPEEIKKGLGVEDYEWAVKTINEYCLSQNVSKATMVFPPAFYDDAAINTWLPVTVNNGWEVEYVDINFSFDLNKVEKEYESYLSKNGKKNLRIALTQNLSLRKCLDGEEKQKAYRIIKANREAKGYPLRMTEEQVMQTIEVVPSDMFLASLEGQDIASALVYSVTDKIAQVIYWGDLPGFSERKVMNFMAYELIGLYSARGYQYLDIGPSTERGIPNYGLCDFKDSIGCDRTAKFRVTKRFK